MTHDGCGMRLVVHQGPLVPMVPMVPMVSMVPMVPQDQLECTQCEYESIKK